MFADVFGAAVPAPVQGGGQPRRASQQPALQHITTTHHRWQPFIHTLLPVLEFCPPKNIFNVWKGEHIVTALSDCLYVHLYVPPSINIL